MSPIAMSWTKGIVFMCILLVVVTTIDSMWERHRSSSSAPTRPNASRSNGTGNNLPVEAEENEELARRNAELLTANRLASETAKWLDDGRRIADAWTHSVQELNTSQEGKLVAQHHDLVQKVAYLTGQPRPTSAELVSLRTDLVQMESELTTRQNQPEPEPLPEELSPKLRDLHEQSRDALAQWKSADDQLRAIVREAVRRSQASSVAAEEPAASLASSSRANEPSPSPPSVSTPESPAPSNAAKPVEASRPEPAAPAKPSPPVESASSASRSASTDLADAVQRQRDQESLAKVEAEMQRQRELAAEQETLRLAKERRQLEEAERKAAQLEEARSPEVAQELMPFLARRSLQPRLAGSSVQMSRTFDDRPMSLSALQGIGALSATDDGLETLARVGGHRELGSPKWSMRPSSRTWNDETREQLKRAQELLRRLGPVMVEAGLLSP